MTLNNGLRIFELTISIATQKGQSYMVQKFASLSHAKKIRFINSIAFSTKIYYNLIIAKDILRGNDKERERKFFS